MNKASDERYLHRGFAVNYLDTELLLAVIDRLRARYQVLYVRPRAADIVNDHTGLTDPDMAATIAAHRAGLVVTHLSLEPKQVQAGRHSVSVANPSTRSTRTRPYQLRSKIAISPAAGRRCQKRQR